MSSGFSSHVRSNIHISIINININIITTINCICFFFFYFGTWVLSSLDFIYASFESSKTPSVTKCLGRWRGCRRSEEVAANTKFILVLLFLAGAKLLKLLEITKKMWHAVHPSSYHVDMFEVLHNKLLAVK